MAWAKQTNGTSAASGAGEEHMVVASGHMLSRRVTFQFTLDPTLEQARRFEMCAGARRFAFNHHLARITANLDVRQAEKDAGTPKDQMTPSLSWSAVSLINHFNAFKTGRAVDGSGNVAPGRASAGLPWQSEIPADVFECASVDAATALKNFSESRLGARRGRPVGFPKFKAKHRDTPSFRLRNRAKPGQHPCKHPIRFTDAKHLRLPVIGEVRMHGSTRKLRRMLGENPQGSVRFHIYSATLTKRAGKWIVSLNGVAAELHGAHRISRQAKNRPVRVGVDLGVGSDNLAVVANEHGHHLKTFKGVKALRAAEAKLRRANKALARTKPGSKGRAEARAKVAKIHRQVANIRRHWIHQITHDLVTGNLMTKSGSVKPTVIVIEDLNVDGMKRNRHLSESVSDAAMGELVRQLRYKAQWHGVEVITADRWFPSSKTCSGCGTIKQDLGLAMRGYHCDACGLEIDRDLNAAVNLARWAPTPAPPTDAPVHPPPALAA